MGQGVPDRGRRPRGKTAQEVTIRDTGVIPCSTCPESDSLRVRVCGSKVFVEAVDKGMDQLVSVALDRLGALALIHAIREALSEGVES